MSRGFCLLLFIILITGCAEKKHTPHGIIPPDKMVGLMWDMIKADQYAYLYFAKDSLRGTAKGETLALYQKVFLLHDVSREKFQRSFQYYLTRPDLTRLLLDSVMAQANRERMEANKQQLRPGGVALPSKVPNQPFRPVTVPNFAPGRPNSLPPAGTHPTSKAPMGTRPAGSSLAPELHPGHTVPAAPTQGHPPVFGHQSGSGAPSGSTTGRQRPTTGSSSSHLGPTGKPAVDTTRTHAPTVH